MRRLSARCAPRTFLSDNLTCKPETNVPAIPTLDTLGDDTVPLRSGAAYEPLSKMLNDGQYYFVNGVHHMTLGADPRACRSWWWAY